MSGVTFQLLLGSQAGATANFVAHSGIEGGFSTSHTFSIDCGLGGNVVAAIGCSFSGTISSVTIGGVSATIHVQRQAGGTNAPVGLASAAGVAPGTQSVVVNTSAGCASWTCHTFNLVGVGSLTPTSTGSGAATFGGDSGTLSNPANGCTIGMTHCGNGGSPATWTGLTKDVEDASGSHVECSAHANFTSANSALAWSTSFGGSNNQTSAVWASWGP